MTSAQHPMDPSHPHHSMRVARGESVFQQGEVGEVAYLLESGQISIHQHIDGHSLELDSVRPGEIFGEMAVLGGGRRMASAIAAEDSVIARVPAPIFHDKLMSADRFLRALVQMVIKNIHASHRVFLRRPRSFRDHIRQMKAFAGNIRRFTGRLEDQALRADMAATLHQLESALEELSRLALRCPDQRHDIIIDAEEAEGVGLDQVVGSESRRRVFAPPRP